MTGLMNQNHDYCRLCLVHDRSALTVHIYKSIDIQQSITFLLNRYFSFLILMEEDKYSKLICTECWQTITKFHSFYQRIENAQKVLLTATIDVENVTKDETKISQLKDYKTNTVKLSNEIIEFNLPILEINDEVKEISCEYASDEFDNDEENPSSPTELNDTVSLFKTTSECSLDIELNTKNETNNLCAVSPRNDKYNNLSPKGNINTCSTNTDSIDTVVAVHKASRESEKPKIFKCESDENNDTDNDDEEDKDTERVDAVDVDADDVDVVGGDANDIDTDDAHDIDDNGSDDDDYNSFNDDIDDKLKKDNDCRKRRTRPTFEKNNAKICEHFRMECAICQHPFEKYTDARKHFRLIHKQDRGYLTCCGGQKFYLPQQMLDHISVHINPDTFKCKICNKVYRNRLMMKRHMQEHDTTIERFSCDKCNKTYPKKYELTKHMRQSHYTEDDKKFKCKICGKKFLANRMLNDHIGRMHIKETKTAKCICDMCAKEFTNQFALNSHIRVDHLNIKSPKVQCPICEKWITSKKTLRQHMGSHEVSPKKCSLCNTVLKNNSCLQSHLSKVHKAPTFKCILCSSAFKNAVALREHIAAHTGQDLYSCPYCPKTFKSNSNLHHHRKRIHEAEFERDRGTRTLQKIIQ